MTFQFILFIIKADMVNYPRFSQDIYPKLEEKVYTI